MARHDEDEQGHLAEHNGTDPAASHRDEDEQDELTRRLYAHETLEPESEESLAAFSTGADGLNLDELQVPARAPDALVAAFSLLLLCRSPLMQRSAPPHACGSHAGSHGRAACEPLPKVEFST